MSEEIYVGYVCPIDGQLREIIAYNLDHAFDCALTFGDLVIICPVEEGS